MGASPPSGVETFYIDASVPEAVRKAIASVRKDVLYAGGPSAPPVNTPDVVWLAQAGAKNWVVLGRDKKIKVRVRERQALIESGVRSFCLNTGGNLNCWETLSLLVLRWEGIERIASQHPGPYVYSVKPSGVTPMFVAGLD